MASRDRKKRVFSVLLLLSLVLGTVPSGLAQTKVKPGFNIFSENQDIEIGRESAAQVERELPILKHRSAEDYIKKIGERLARKAPGGDYPYQFRITNLSDINAFALPGGFMYINRGLIEAAGSEAELAGVMAHEIGHVALRHGTNQASKAYLTQAGLGILGGLLGRGGTGQIIEAVGGFGLNALFLKFSRTAETQSDLVGAQMLAQAGYDPMAMARFFEKLREETDQDPGKMEEFFSSHPPPADRAKRVQEEVRLIGHVSKAAPVGDFRSLQRQLSRLPDAPSMRELAGAGPDAELPEEIPSSELELFTQKDRVFEILFPVNWEAWEDPNGVGVTLAPRGGIVASDGNQHIVRGVLVSHFTPQGSTVRDGTRREGRVSLSQASDEVLHQILKANPYLELVRGSQRRERLDGASAYSAVLTGRSPVTEQEERVTLFTRSAGDGHLLSVLFIAASDDYRKLGNLFERMILSLRVRDLNTH